MPRKKRTLDPDEAPAGYKAKLVTNLIPRSCAGCCFQRPIMSNLMAYGCLTSNCTPGTRADGCDVVFVKINTESDEKS